MFRKIVAFSLFGDSPRYLSGAIDNARLISSVLPGWIAVFYCGDSVPQETLVQIKDSGAYVVECADAESYSSTVWRYRVFTNFEDCEIFLARDVDSLISEREAAMVSKWVNSDFDFMVIRDHPNHIWHMPAGLVGFKRSRTMTECLENVVNHSGGNHYGIDADLLYRHVWQSRKLSKLVIDTFSIFNEARFEFGHSRDYCGRIAFDEAGFKVAINDDLPAAQTLSKLIWPSVKKFWAMCAEASRVRIRRIGL